MPLPENAPAVAATIVPFDWTAVSDELLELAEDEVFRFLVRDTIVMITVAGARNGAAIRVALGGTA